MPFFKKNFLRNFPHSFQKSLPHVCVLYTCRYVWAHWWILIYRSEADVIFLYYSPSWFLRQDLLLSLSSGNSARQAASEPPTPGLQALSTVPGIYVSARHLNWSPHAYITSTFPTEPSSHPRVSFLGLTSAILFLEVTKSESYFHSLVLRPSLADVNSVGGLERWLSAVHTCGPESAALELTWKQAWPHVPITAELGEGRHKDRFAKDRCYQPGWQTELQAQWETLSQGNGWRAIEGDAWNLLRPVHGHSHMCIWTTHTHTKTQQPQTTQTSTRSEKCLQQPWHLHGAQYQSQDGHCGHGHVEVFPPDQVRKAMKGPLMQDIATVTACAYYYKNEEAEAIRGQMKEKGVKWEDFFIVSKFWATCFEGKLLNRAIRSPSGSGTGLFGPQLIQWPWDFSPESFPTSDKVSVLTSKITFLDVGKVREDLVNEELVKAPCCSLLCPLRVLPPSYQINTPRGLLLINAQY